MVENILKSSISKFDDFLFLRSSILLCSDCLIGQNSILNYTYILLSKEFLDIIESNKFCNKAYFDLKHDLKLLHIKKSCSVEDNMSSLEQIENILNNKYSKLINSITLKELLLIISESKKVIKEIIEVNELIYILNTMIDRIRKIALTSISNTSLNNTNKLVRYLDSEWSNNILKFKINYTLLNRIVTDFYQLIPEGIFDNSSLEIGFINEFYKRIMSDKDIKLIEQNICVPPNSNVIALNIYRRSKNNCHLLEE